MSETEPSGSLCAYTGCNRAALLRGYCRCCYQRARREGTITIIVPKPGSPRARKTDAERATCATPGCGRASTVRGFCQLCYYVERRAGRLQVVQIRKSTERMGKPSVPPAERLLAKVDKNGPIQPHMTTPCWLFKGHQMDNGYGQFNVSAEVGTLGAHRASYLLFVGPLEDGLDVCHHCDVRNCVRPDHLFQGTRRQNMRDASAKGRLRNKNPGPVAQATAP